MLMPSFTQSVFLMQSIKVSAISLQEAPMINCRFFVFWLTMVILWPPPQFSCSNTVTNLATRDASLFDIWWHTAGSSVRQVQHAQMYRCMENRSKIFSGDSKTCLDSKTNNLCWMFSRQFLKHFLWIVIAVSAGSPLQKQIHPASPTQLICIYQLFVFSCMPYFPHIYAVQVRYLGSQVSPKNKSNLFQTALQEIF